jgi:isoleucyl-tRNA synthetase
VRLSRRRFWDGDPTAFATLHDCLVTTAKLLAPLTPFVADEIYENLDGSEPSVHLCDFPKPGARDEGLEWRMQVVRDAVELGRAARAHARLKVRQPLAEAVVVAADRERAAIEGLEGLLAEELNVRAVRYVSEADELGRFELKPNYRALGPRFGKQMPQVAAAIAALDPARLRAGDRVGINVEGQDHEIGPDDVQLVLQPLEGYQVERSGTHAVALNLELDDELRREALAREVVHAVQAARKNAGLNVEDRIELTLGGDEELLAATRAHEEYVAGETLATSVAYDGAGGDGAATAEIEGRRLLISVNPRTGMRRSRSAGP